ncbi:LOW QUALITY PROTEIN: fibrocystin-L-like [Lingula anatina]|uniref:LOW QUALITY PROTEIN: fibrocystin-L-like n=1 Tax=Lingula anatina TaxID=7574 RepID=A0A1S3IUK2_LINAN|nr:LOW QUALITY PROTEIN: fibrocystin-L-like [Lingula anatina]|eukprot:XP_013401885.1 LOW QUALITY PROTEIN: fibrocystin-L-like [Lingula anatina]
MPRSTISCLVVIYLVLSCSSATEAVGASITNVLPSTGSVVGGTRFNVYGKNFCDVYTNQNEVKLVGENGIDYPLRIDAEASHEEDLVVDYVGTSVLPEGSYTISVTSCGEKAALCPRLADCQITLSSAYTPTIRKINQSAIPGSLIRAEGFIISDRYGSDMIDSTLGGRLEQLRHVKLSSGRRCELVNRTTLQKYGVKLTTIEGEGFFWCEITGSYVGDLNITYLIEGGYGSSLTDLRLIRVSSTDNLYVIQTYPDIASTSHNSGSTEGQTHLRVNGTALKNDSSYPPPKVKVGGIPCAAVIFEDKGLMCKTPPEPEVIKNAYAGNRGIYLERWNSGVSNNDLTAVREIINRTTTPDKTFWLDEFYFEEDNGTYFTTRMQGYFVPPKNTTYRFYLKGDDYAVLFFSLTDNPDDAFEIAMLSRATTSYFTTYGTQMSQTFTLQAGKPYYIAATHAQLTAEASLYVAVVIDESSFTSSQTTLAKEEKQVLTLSAENLPEIQTVELQNWASRTPTREVQTITVGSGASSFRLGFRGVKTKLIDVGSSGSTVKAALNSLPSIMPDSVGVSKSGNDYTVTFNSDDIGDVELLDVEGYGVTVSQTTTGVSAMDKIYFTMEGVVSPPVRDDASADDVKAALRDLFKVRCADAITTPGSALFHQDFEAETNNIQNVWGTVVRHVTPYCGLGCVHNPNYFIRHKSIRITSANIHFCFAHKGRLSAAPLIRIDFDHIARGRRRIWYVDGPVPSITWTDSWQYDCIELMPILNKRTSLDKYIQIRHISIIPASSTLDLYYDDIMLVNSKPNDVEEFDNWRYLPPRSDRFIMDYIEVTKNGGVYNITMKPWNCESDFPLLNVLQTSVNSGSLDSNTVVLGASGNKVHVNRVQAASLPVKGDFIVTFGNGNISAPINATAYALEKSLQTLEGIGEVEVERLGYCHNYVWNINWKTAGNIPLLQINDNQLTGPAERGLTINEENGHTFYKYGIPGDMLRTYHTIPQLTVEINNVPAKCSGNCDFQWQSAMTPTVSSVTPVSGSSLSSTVLTVQGTGFGTTPADNLVTIGGEPCVVTSATATQLQCNIGDGPVGTHTVDVNVLSKGLAQHVGGTFNFTYDFLIFDISPVNGSLGGCTLLTVRGTGFASGTVEMAGEPCSIQSQNYSHITCRTPAVSSPGAVQLTVSQAAGTISSPTNFTYVNELTPEISSVTITTTTSCVQGGGNLTILGTGFGSTPSSSGAVRVGHFTTKIMSYNDTQIIVRLPPVSPGVHDFVVEVAPNGCADLRRNNIGNFTCNFEVDSVYPTQGSVYGGTNVVIVGDGFTADTNITFGNVSCDITAVNQTKICCVTRDSATKHIVKNTVVNNKFAWSPSVFTVQVGDVVRWEWNSEPSSGFAFKIEQTASAVADSYDGKGFRSGSPVPSGAFEYRFGQVGTVYYWSGTVDTRGLMELRGTIHVEKRRSQAALMAAKVGDIEAKYNVNSGVSVSDGCDSGCTNNITQLSTGCLEDTPSTNDSSHFEFAFSLCSAAVITSMMPNKGTPEVDVVLEGSGFSDIVCENVVLIGDHTCSITSVNNTRIVCSLMTESDFPAGELKYLTLNVTNRGLALVSPNGQLQRGFIMIPRLDNVQPASGSVAGGTLLTLTGDGFSGDLGDKVVRVGNTECPVVSANYTSIICRTDPQMAFTGNVTVTISGRITSVCPTDDCIFEYSDQQTPTLTSVSPVTLQGSGTQVSLKGSKFGTNTAAVDITVGGVTCVIDTISDTEISCTLGYAPVGNQPLVVYISPMGYPQSTAVVSLESVPLLQSVTPNQGSTQGGTNLTIFGAGFVEGMTTVTVGGVQCHILAVNLSTILCTTEAHAVGAVDVAVVSNGVQYPTGSYSYSTAATPIVSSINPTSGMTGDTVNIAGTGFDPGVEMVKIDNAYCVVQTASATAITCILGDHAAGHFAVEVAIQNKGRAVSDVYFNYTLSVSSVAPVEGSYGGGQLLTLEGVGFSTIVTDVNVCGRPCVVRFVNSTYISCEVPPSQQSPTSGSTEQCPIEVAVNNAQETASTQYAYKAALTPTITSVSPARGGTGGGTLLTITGTNFGTSNVVSIDGTTCDVQSASSTTIVCRTRSHTRTIRTKVRVEVDDKGIATQDNADYFYVDVWSSRHTWGGDSPPVAGDYVVIQEGQTIYLDVSTPVLRFLLIRGGKLVFDEVDVELHSEYIFIADGGALQVGTADAPFQHKAVIELHGHVKTTELPIYGAKMIAVRNGTLDLHGQYIPVTWTLLAQTAGANTNTLTLKQPVTWQPGEEIVIATTGGHLSQKENEKRIIQSVSADGLTLTLTEPLEYEHLGITRMVEGEALEIRAEVGLLTRNVVIRGSVDDQWTQTVEACEAGFKSGEFDTQTCFQGLFGDEELNDEFGAHIIIHPPSPNSHCVHAHISYTELTHVGQAFRLGRYPIHFHLMGNTSYDEAYVRGCSIHDAYNRAVNIHGTHYVLVEHTFIYNIRGGAFFLEDGIETKNIFQYDLAIFVRQSTSLLNDDITPAAFWITNPDNVIRHCHVAGGTHFGYWYRMKEHPEGPSYDPTICPPKVPLGEFYNNTGHSLGQFVLWIFPDFYPMQGGSCNSMIPEPATFSKLTAYNSLKGMEVVNGGALQFSDIILFDNYARGIEYKLIMQTNIFSADGPFLNDIVVIGHSLPAGRCTDRGLILPFAAGLNVNNTRFINFDQSSCAVFGATFIECICVLGCGGWEQRFQNLEFVNSENRGAWRWINEVVMTDMDSSLTGHKGYQIVPYNPTFTPSKCTRDNRFSKGAVDGYLCEDSVRIRKFSLHQPSPASLEFKRAILSNQYGTAYLEWLLMRNLVHSQGWMTDLLCNVTYDLTFEDSSQISNISYQGAYYGIQPDCCIIMCHNLTRQPDRVSILSTDGDRPFEEGSPSPLTCENNYNGDFYYYTNINKLCYMISGRDRPTRKKRALMVEAGTKDRNVHFKAYRCFYIGCVPPADPNTIPPVRERPDVFQLWSATTTWGGTDTHNGATYKMSAGTTGSGPLPVDGESVGIREGDWVVADMALPVFDRLELNGTLELEYQRNPLTNQYYNFVINATYIIIKFPGRLIIGWSDNVFMGSAQIILRGTRTTPDYLLPGYGPEVGSKAIAAFGGLDLHGKDVVIPWTELARPASAGDTTITLRDDISDHWNPNDDIMITATGFNPFETEIRRITAVSGKVVTLNASLSFNHRASEETINGIYYRVAAEVGLLSRNIKIIGQDYPDLYSQSYGARVVVSSLSWEENGVVKVAKGYARLSNVEFYHSGQEGWTSEFDARYSLAYIQLQTVNNLKPSFVKKCSFHSGFSTAIGVYGTSSERAESDALNIELNVVHHTVGPSIIVTGTNHTLRKNLVALSLWRGSYQDRNEIYNFLHPAAIELHQASRLTLQDNHVAGSERSGFRLTGEKCGSSNDPTVHPLPWSGNVAHSVLTGVLIWPVDCSGTCLKLSGFTVATAWDHGIYVQSGCSIEVTGVTFVDNTLGFFGIVIGPAALSHSRGNKYIDVSESLVVGNSPDYNCTDTPDYSDVNIKNSGLSRSVFQSTSSSQVGKVAGLIFPQFHSSENKAPKKDWQNAMDFIALTGIMRVRNVTFAHFGTKCGKRSFAITDIPDNEDFQFPIEVSNAFLYQVDEDSVAFYHRPELGAINPTDCVDMDCDGQKKLLIKDTDGSLLAGLNQGSLVADSAFEWDGDRRRGLGDYRIPKAMLTAPNGTKLDVNILMPNKGIIGTSTTSKCTWRSMMQAYKCHDMDYEVMIIESMDANTLTHRIGPVAIHGEDYIDLINGPQDYHWCDGYTCKERLSTFYSVVATGKHFDIYFTGTAPQDLRLFMINTKQTDVVRVAVFYSNPQKLVVSSNGAYVKPKNSGYDSLGREVTQRPTYPGHYLPDLSTDGNGANYFDMVQKLLYVIVAGTDIVDVTTIPQVFLVIGANNVPLPITDFFGENLVQNIAFFLDIPPNKIRIANIVSEDSRRKKRATTGNVMINIEIGDVPSRGDTDVASISQTPYTKLANASAMIYDAVQLGKISQVLNISVINVTLEEPLPPTNDSVWEEIQNSREFQNVIQIPSRLELIVQPEALHEGAAFSVPAGLRMYDTGGNVVEQLGSLFHPWQLTATLRSGSGTDSRARAVRTVTVSYKQGWANFTDLGISHSGSGYILDFTFTYPSEASRYSAFSSAITVAERPLTVGVAEQPTNTTSGEMLEPVAIEIRDKVTNEALVDIAWKGHSWQSEVSLYMPSSFPATLTGTTSADFNASVPDQRAVYDDLILSTTAEYPLQVFLKFRAWSTPSEFDFTTVSRGIVFYPVNYTSPMEEVNKTVSIKWSGDYSTVASGKEHVLEGFIHNFVMAAYHEGVFLRNFNFTEGSIISTFEVVGTQDGVNSTLLGLWEKIKAGWKITVDGQSMEATYEMYVDGDRYYGNDDGPPVVKPASQFPAWAIVVIILIVILVIGGILAFVYYKNKKVKKHALDGSMESPSFGMTTKGQESKLKSHHKYIAEDGDSPRSSHSDIHKEHHFKNQVGSEISQDDTDSGRKVFLGADHPLHRRVTPEPHDPDDDDGCGPGALQVPPDDTLWTGQSATHRV